MALQVGGRAVVEKDLKGQPPEPRGSGGGSAPQRSFTLAETLRTPAFCLLCADVVSGCILGAGPV
jgi:hypothetical protein